jgi:membrane-bound acyltransferase YfiQ involved in biofilm formation
MALLYLILLTVLLIGVKTHKKGLFFDDFMGMDQCNAVKGLFILMVFVSHSMLEVKDCGYDFSGVIDQFGERIRSEFGQLIVVMFLFYSGYGVMESIMRKGRDYLTSFPHRRILMVLVNFDIAVLLFVLLDLALGIRLNLRQIILSLFAWRSVGNSNWYIFVILYCYLITYIGFRLFNKSNILSVVFVALMIFAGMMVLSYRRPSNWYNTILCYPAGMFLSISKEKVVSFLKKYYWAVLIGSMALLLLFRQISFLELHGFTYNMKSLVFALLIILLTMKLKTGNAFLYWSGIHLFPLYIYQRIPMIAIRELAGKSWVCSYPYLYIILCFLITLLIVLGYKHWQVKFD